METPSGSDAGSAMTVPTPTRSVPRPRSPSRTRSPLARGRGGYYGRGGRGGRGGQGGRGMAGLVRRPRQPPPEFVPFLTRPAPRSGIPPNGFGARSTSNTFPSRREPMLKPKQEWVEWQELSVRVRRLPSDVTTWDLHHAFDQYGTITFIELNSATNGQKDGTGQIRFSPPPAKDFWSSGRYPISIAESGGTIVVCDILLLTPKNNRGWKVESPVRKGVSYPQLLKVFPSWMDFGFMIKSNTMMHMRTAPSRAPKDLVFQVDLQRKRLTIFFPYRFSDGDLARDTKYMVLIPFEQIEKIHKVDLDDRRTSYILSLDSPPCFFRKRQDIEASHAKESFTWSEWDTWYRQTDIIYDPRTIKYKAVSLKKGELEIDIGRWTTYRFVIERNSTNTLSTFNTILEALKDFNIPILPFEGFNMVPPVEPRFWSLLDQETVSQSALSLLDESQSNFHLDFEIRYQLEVCISQGVLLEHNLTAEFLSVLAKLSQENTAKARSILEYFADLGDRVHDPMTIFENKEALGQNVRIKIPHYCAYARKATITPSGIYFSTPSVETSNRVIRHFAEFGDRFLRVQFTDEKTEGRINSHADKVKNDELYSRVFRTLSNGIIIGDRKYEFLAFGNSQFRQNGAYFFCPSDDISCDNIRGWMGQFDHIRGIAKYAARLGQCFSTTRAIHGTRVEIGKIPDIERNGFTFTDGVGKISELLAQLIATELGLPISDHVPSAFQFRLGGCKGILVVWPDTTGRQVKIRPSQQKFEAVYNGLEIIRCSQHSTATLNRQTITILSALGVPNEVFLDMLTKQLADYETAMTDRSMAMGLLQRWIDENNMTITIASMIVNGFMDTKEPFLMSLLHLWRAWSIKLLKEKAKIMVEDGAFVLGCIDETGKLKGHSNTAKPNVEADLPEIFLQVPDVARPGKYKIIQGTCLLGRNPSLHPGDLRVVMAVDIPELRHLRDVVVFPQLGDRDIPSMCSGGDLDGDDFFVIWDKDLTPKEWNVTPMNYAAPAPRQKSSPVVVQDLMKFFVKFMKNDTLPTIAHAHLAQSDLLERGVKDPICLELAELHSKAVDYVKSGEAAVMRKHLGPRRWPQFMEKKYKPKAQIYQSYKVLGLLYEKVESVDFVPQYAETFDKRILRAYKLDSDMLKTARQIKTQYDVAMKRIMAQMDIGTEFEVYSTFILSKPRVGSDYKLQEEMGIVSNSLKDRFRAACIDAAGGKDFVQLAPFVAAMYQVTSEEMQIALAECRDTRTVGGRDVPLRSMTAKSMPCISFPWIFHEVLGRIAAGTEAHEDLEELGMLVLRPSGAANQRRRRVNGEDEDDEDDDVLITDEGYTHRGEVLDLFRPDVQDEFTMADVNSDQNKDEVDARNLHSAGQVAPNEETGLDDEFDGPEIDGFIHPERAIGHGYGRSTTVRTTAQINDLVVHTGGGSGFSTDNEGRHESLTPISTDEDSERNSVGESYPVSLIGDGVAENMAGDVAGQGEEESNDEGGDAYEQEIVGFDDEDEESGEDPIETLRRMVGGHA